MGYINNYLLDLNNLIGVVIYAAFVTLVTIFYHDSNVENVKFENIKLKDIKIKNMTLLILSIVKWNMIMQIVSAIYYYVFGENFIMQIQEIAYLLLRILSIRKKDIKNTIVSASAIEACQKLIMAEIGFMFANFEFVNKAFGMTIGHIFLFALALIFLKKFEVTESFFGSYSSAIITLIMIMSAVMSSVNWIESTDSTMLYQEFLNGIMLILVLTIYYLYYKINEENKRNTDLAAISSQVEITKNSYEITQKHYEQMSILRHELKNHDAYLKLLVDEGDFDKLKDFLNDSMQKREKLLRKNDYGNVLINSIINYEMSVADEKNIEFSTNIVVDSKINIPDMDLFSIIMNIIDNAIEACEFVEEEKRRISLSITQKGNYLFIHEENTFKATAPKYEILKLETNKPNKKAHGYGTKIVDIIAQRHNGYVRYDMSTDKFITDIMLLIKDIAK